MQYRLSLTLGEKQFLYRKYRGFGLEHEEASFEVEKICNSQRDLVRKLLNQKKSEKDIETKFRENFEEICRKLEVRRDG